MKTMLLILAICAGRLCYAQTESEKHDKFIAEGKKAIAAKEYTRAVSKFNQALAIEIYSTEALIGRAGAYYHLEQLQKALDDYNVLLSFKEDYADGYFRRGVIKHKLGDTRGACRDWKSSYKIKPNPKTQEYIIKKCK